jgi:4-amino-4-deoxy-L-arabinose transferase-like glycosyltransferase
VISAVIGLLILRFFAREASARLGVVLLLITTATPLLDLGATLLTVDPLNVLFWTAAMLAGWRAAQPDGTTRQWLWTGLWMGLGFLSKYTALFQLLCWVVFFALWPPARKHLRRPGPYLAILVNSLCMLPVLIWNWQHGWITITHVNERAQIGGGFSLTARYLGEFLGSEFGLLNPFFFVGMVWAAVAFWRSERSDARLVYFFSMGAPPVLVYVLQSLHARVLPNWIAPAVLPLFCLMVFYWDARRNLRWVRRGLTAGLTLGFVALVLLSDTDLIQRIVGRPLPVRFDPLHRVRGWSELSRIVGEQRNKLAAEGKPTFIICTHYTYTSQITFYLPEAKASVHSQPLVYFRNTEQPENQFFYWPRYRYLDRKGDNAIFVTELPRPNSDSGPPPAGSPPPPELSKQFGQITDLGVFNAGYKGRPIWWVQLFACRNLL